MNYRDFFETIWIYRFNDFIFNVRFGANTKDFSNSEYWSGTKSSGPPAQSSTPVAGSFWNRGVWSSLSWHCYKGICQCKYLGLMGAGEGEGFAWFPFAAIRHLLLLYLPLNNNEVFAVGENHYLNPERSKWNSLFSLCMYHTVLIKAELTCFTSCFPCFIPKRIKSQHFYLVKNIFFQAFLT